MRSHVKTFILGLALSFLVAVALTQMPRQAQGTAGGADNPHSGPPTETPRPGLTKQDIATTLSQAEATANATDSGLRAVAGDTKKTRMHIAVVNRDGELLAIRSMSDAWVGSYDIAIAKARTAASFSSDQNALT